MSRVTLLFGLLIVNCIAESTIYGMTLWESKDFYYRAIAAIYLRVMYYSDDHSNVLDDVTLTEIQNIEQEIKSWTGYSDHSLIYKETDQDMEDLFNVSPLYLESATPSVINFVFPQLILDTWIMNGNGDTINEEWLDDLLQVAPASGYYRPRRHIWDYSSTEIWFNPRTFSANSQTPTSPFLISYYPFGYKNENETTEELYAWVDSYAQLFDTIITDTIFISYSNSRTSDFAETLGLDDKIYQNNPTVQPTIMPTTMNNSLNIRWRDQEISEPCYQFGYSTTNGQSTGAIVAVKQQIPTETHVSYSPTVSPTETVAPTQNPTTTYPTGAPIVDQFELCRETFWPNYIVNGNNNDMIYFDNYQWNLVDGNNQYYCSVSVKDVTFCNGQWQSVDNGEYVDIILDIDPNFLVTTETVTTETVTTTKNPGGDEGNGIDGDYVVIKLVLLVAVITALFV